MATSFELNDIKRINNVFLNAAQTELVYEIISNDDKKKNINENDIPSQTLNSAIFARYIQQIPHMPMKDVSHLKLSREMKQLFKSPLKVRIQMSFDQHNENNYCPFTIKSSHFTGIYGEELCQRILDHYISGCVLMYEWIPQDLDEVIYIYIYIYTFMLFNFYLYFCYKLIRKLAIIRTLHNM